MHYLTDISCTFKSHNALLKSGVIVSEETHRSVKQELVSTLEEIMAE